MKDLLEASNIIQIADNNPNLLPTIVVILAVVYIIYAIISISYNKKRLKQLNRLRRKIQIRHDNIEVENERRRRLEIRKNSQNTPTT